MIRLTLLLLVVIAVAMIVGGRKLPDQGPDQDVASAGAAVAPVPGAKVAPAIRPAPQELAPPRTFAEQKAPAEDLLLDTSSKLPSGETPAPPPPAPVVADVEPDTSGADTGADTAQAEPAADPGALPSVEDEITAALAAAQVRFVNASLVNVRAGPSTDYDVVGKVSYGEALQILSEPEDGWVRIRSDAGGVEGYMADRFLSDAEPNG